MFRAVLLLVALAGAVRAAPQLKPVKPAPDTEGARIAVLQDKYDQLRRTAGPDERDRLNNAAALVERLALILEFTRATGTPGQVAGAEGTLNRYLAEDPAHRDFYDIFMYERARKKAAGKK
jgi:hypothetical protein